MYQVFNMGTRLELYTDSDTADELIDIAHSFGVQAQVIGHVISAPSGQVSIERPGKDPLHFPALKP